MFAVFDTETTGFIKPNANHEDQPHCCQIAILLCEDDGTEVESFEAIIKPEGWEIPERVAEIHGISTERAHAEGIPLLEAMTQFDTIAKRSGALVAHNIDFDIVVVGAAYFRTQLPNPLTLLPRRCTMKAATNIVCIPKTRGSGFKWPKLLESHLHFFNEGFEDAHSAMADVKACKRVYMKLLEEGAFA